MHVLQNLFVLRYSDAPAAQRSMDVVFLRFQQLSLDSEKE